jgi:uncharacterized protein (TIGR00266 family)
VDYDISGILNQILTLRLSPGERLWVQKNALMSYTTGVSWKPRIPGGLVKTFSRYFSGESLFLLDVTTHAEAKLMVAPSVPSIVYEWDLANGPVTTLHSSFLAGIGKISINVDLARNPLAAFFGGAGLLLQTISGQGRVFIALSGDLIEYDMLDGQSILVSTGNLAAFSRGTGYSIRSVGGCLKMIFGGEGIFMTRLCGPGKVLVQNMKRTPKTARKFLGKILNLINMVPA